MATAKQAAKQTTTSTAASRAANPLPSMAATATGQTAPRQQKLAYAQGTASLKLVPSAAKTSAQQVHLQALQSVFGKAKTMQAQAVTQALVKAGHANPRRIYRRAIRAGLLVTA